MCYFGSKTWSIRIHGTLAQVGDEVAAINESGTVCGRGNVIEEGFYGPMFVYGGNNPQAANVSDGCFFPGETISFKIVEIILN